MKVIDTSIPDVKIIEPQIYSDERGIFFESWNQKEFDSLVEPTHFVQDNHSISHKGVLRGLHFQNEPYEQGKLVRVINGSAFDVAVDIRKNSKYYGQYVSVLLSASNMKMFWIPKGFAHGFLALEDNTHFLYKTTNFYDRNSEASVNYNDPALNIKWPSVMKILVNNKDSLAPNLSEI